MISLSQDFLYNIIQSYYLFMQSMIIIIIII